LILCALPAAACGPPAVMIGTPLTQPAPAADDGRAATAELARVEEEVLGWMSAADPRLAVRSGVAAPREVVERIGTAAVLAEDATAGIRGSSLDLFAFGARTRAIGQAARVLASLHGDLPEIGPVGVGVARPRLERELLARFVAEELARAEDEARLGDASGDLVRGMVATWTPPATPQDVPDRDAWAAKHLLEIRDSLHDSRPPTGPLDLDVALYPLERLLAPLQYPRGAAAIAQVRMALDEDSRATPKVSVGTRVAHAIQVHLGLAVDPAAIATRLDRIEVKLREAASRELQTLDDVARTAALSRARELLFVEGLCPASADCRLGSMAPSPERAAVCGALRALGDDGARVAAMVALHDDVILSYASVTASPPPRTRLLSHPTDEDFDSLQRMARERPALALGPAFAAEILQGGEGRLAAWRTLGDAPLDVVARELGAR